MQKIHLPTWYRKEHFEFFSQFSNPFFGVTVELEVTQAFQTAKQRQASFFAWYLYQSIRAVNQVPEFKYRLIDGDVYELAVIHATATIARDDGSFAFSFIPFLPEFESFLAAFQTEKRATQNSQGLRKSQDTARLDVIHFTTLPWLQFTSFTAARDLKRVDSIPKISFGKLFEKEGKRFLPVAIEVHHGLADGRHVGTFVQVFQDLLMQS